MFHKYKNNGQAHLLNLTLSLLAVTFLSDDNLTQIRTNRMSLQIWTQTVWNSDSDPERIFEKVRWQKKHERLCSMQRVWAQKSSLSGAITGLTLCPPRNCFPLFVVQIQFQNQLFRKILSGIWSECQIVWIQIRPDKMPGLIWIQTVCKSYQQMTLEDK